MKLLDYMIGIPTLLQLVEPEYSGERLQQFVPPFMMVYIFPHISSLSNLVLTH